MLSRLSIRDIVLIEKLDIDFLPGLSVLTGETGAGKSILLDALSLALGARGDASLVRHGAAQGQVIAVFDVPRNHPARTLLAGNDIEDDGDIILRRVQTADGRTRVFVNDQPSSVTLMRDVGRALVEIHGQHDERALVDPGAHRELLDSFGGHLGAVRGTGEAWRYWRNCEQELSRHRAQAVERLRHFVSRGALDIEGLGAENIDLFFNAGLVKTAADIFTLKDRRPAVTKALAERREEQARLREEASGKARKNVRSVEERNYEGLDKLFSAIDARREPELDRFIFALGIRHIGETTAAVLARQFSTIEELIRIGKETAKAEDPHTVFPSINGIGDTVINALRDFFGNERNDDVLDALLAQVHPKPYVMKSRPAAKSPARRWCSPARWKR
jgi:DNA repair ATPase RecN